LQSNPNPQPIRSIAASIAYFTERYDPVTGRPFSTPPPPPPAPVIPTYRHPFGETSVAHDTLFDFEGNNPIFLRPADIERFYGIPVSTVYDWIHEQPTTHFPAVKLAINEDRKRRLVLIPKRLMDEWIIEHSTLMREKSHTDPQTTPREKKVAPMAPLSYLRQKIARKGSKGRYLPPSNPSV
jgi:hypothetical protein